MRLFTRARLKENLSSVYAKAGALLLFLMYLLSTVLFLAFSYFWARSDDRAEQFHQIVIAKAVARQIGPYVNPTVRYAKLLEVNDELVALNPRLSLFILDRNGNIVISFGRAGQLQRTVDLVPLRRMLEGVSPDELPIYATNPYKPDSSVIFSVAPLVVAGEDHFLYVALAGEPQHLSQSIALIETSLAGAFLATVMITAAVLLFGLLLFYRLTRRFSRMTDIVRSFERGDFSERLPVKTNDEMDTLARAMNLMADRVVENIAELERRDELRRELIADVSHDLRGPLALMRCYVDLFLAPAGMKKEDERTYAEILLKNIESLGTLLDQLFELAKLEAKEVVPSVQPYFMQDTLEDILLGHARLAEARQVGLLSHYPDDLPRVKADSALIERVLTNLIQNAIRHTPRGGTITIRLSISGTELGVEVADTGEGISEEELPRIFEAFFQSSGNGNTRELGSAGLGLAIVRRILDAHGIEILVTSQEGVGTCFSFKLPLYRHETASDNLHASFK